MIANRTTENNDLMHIKTTLQKNKKTHKLAIVEILLALIVKTYISAILSGLLSATVESATASQAQIAAIPKPTPVPTLTNAQAIEPTLAPNLPTLDLLWQQSGPVMMMARRSPWKLRPTGRRSTRRPATSRSRPPPRMNSGSSAPMGSSSKRGGRRAAGRASSNSGRTTRLRRVRARSPSRPTAVSMWPIRATIGSSASMPSAGS